MPHYKGQVKARSRDAKPKTRRIKMKTTYENREGVATWKTGDYIIQIREDVGTASEILHDWKSTKVEGVESIQNWDESDEDVTIYVISGNGGEHAIAVDIGTAIEISRKYVDVIRERLAN